MNFAIALRAASCTLLAAASLFAQSITCNAMAHTELRASADGATGFATTASVPAGTDVSNGIVLNASQNGASSHLRVDADDAVPNRRSFELMAFAMTTGGQPGEAAGNGRSEIVVEVTLDQAMTLDVQFFATVIACTGAVTGTADIDVGNDGTIELHVVPEQNLFGQDSFAMKVPMPAGTTEILMAVELDLPVESTGIGRLVEVRAGLTIRPGHAEITSEGSHCGVNMHSEPRLDGSTVDFFLHGAQGDLPFLVIGAEREHNQMPIAPACWLLVSPDVVLPMTIGTHLPVPLGSLPAGTEVFVQGGVLRPVPIPFSTSGLFLTPRLVVEIF